MLDIKGGLTSNTEKTIEKLFVAGKKAEDVENIRKEFNNRDRTIRESQVGKTQKDKEVGTGEKKRTVVAVRIAINFAKKICRVATAFEVGKPVTLIPSESNKLSQLIKLLWKTNRIDSLLVSFVFQKKSETQSALQLYIADVKPGGLFMKIISFVGAKLGISSQNKEIKLALLENKSGSMSPYFDETGDMKAFSWKFSSKSDEDKDLENVMVWDELTVYKLDNSTGKLSMSEGYPKPHGFDRIPIVYDDQDEPEWFDALDPVDRYETIISKLGGSNDRTAYPLMKLYGELGSFPEADDNGKILQFPIKVDEETGKEIHGDAEFMTNPNGPDSIKLELETLEKAIYSITSTPDLSFDNVKGLGSVSGVALKLMFLDAMIKASMNEGENRTVVERIINIIMSGITKTTNTSLAVESKNLYYDVIFNSILPDDLKELVETMSSAKEAGLVAARTAVERLGLNEDVDNEMQLIAADVAATKEPVKL
jgi:SPP1 family phage portal protein